MCIRKSRSGQVSTVLFVDCASWETVRYFLLLESSRLNSQMLYGLTVIDVSDVEQSNQVTTSLAALVCPQAIEVRHLIAIFVHIRIYNK